MSTCNALLCRQLVLHCVIRLGSSPHHISNEITTKQTFSVGRYQGLQKNDESCECRVFELKPRVQYDGYTMVMHAVRVLY
jgi:hypothetical protein